MHSLHAHCGDLLNDKIHIAGRIQQVQLEIFVETGMTEVFKEIHGRALPRQSMGRLWGTFSILPWRVVAPVSSGGFGEHRLAGTAMGRKPMLRTEAVEILSVC
jgi:hypothetical protein